MRLLCALSATCLLATHAASQPSLAGSWQGYWSRAGDSLPVTLTVRQDSTGGYRASFASPRLRVSGIPFSEVALEGCCAVRMVLRGDRTTAEFTGTLDGDSLSGSMREGSASGSFGYGRVAEETAAFEEREVTFRNGEVTLAGTLLLPRSALPVPGVVFLHGSGAEGRWASRFLAGMLAGEGIAALIFDKRGVGGSSGDWRQATLNELAADDAAAVAFLRAQPEVDAQRVGIHGHSQGGTLAPLVAARAPGVAFVIASSAAGTPTDSTELFSVLNSIYPQVASAQDSADARSYVGELVMAAYHQRPHARLDSLAAALRDRPWFFAPPAPDNAYWRFSPVFARYQPLAWWRRVQVPVLLLYGAADQRVPAETSASRIAAALERAGNHDVTVQLFPGADHTFRLPPGASGWPVTAPDYLPTLLEWLRQR